MIDGNKLGDVGFQYLGVSYSVMDCQKFVEKCLEDCGLRKDLTGSNAWYREVMRNGVIMSPEECVKQLGCVPKGAFLFIHAFDGKEPEKYRKDGKGNASHMGICTMPRGKGAINSSYTKDCVCESTFKGKSINGGWNKVGLWNQVSYDYGGGTGSSTPSQAPILKRGSTGTEVAYVQAILMDLGYDLQPYGADGDFGRKTEEAVKAFQRAHGLTPDGIVGPLTYDALENAAPEEEERFTVILEGLTKAEAEAIKEAYPGAIISAG